MKHGGILYCLDQKGITYQEGWLLKTKIWSEISDVGLFKQESKKSNSVYNYQIKFSDDLPHTFDLRGKYPTKEFNQKVEEFWLNYIYEEPSSKWWSAITNNVFGGEEGWFSKSFSRWFVTWVEIAYS